MNGNFFSHLDYQNDPLWVVKEYFNSINNSFFVNTVSNLVNGIGYGNEYSGCEFPDDLDEYEEPFCGVRVRYFDDEVIVSDEIFRAELINVCQKYLQSHPESCESLTKIIRHLQELGVQS